MEEKFEENSFSFKCVFEERWKYEEKLKIPKKYIFDEKCALEEKCVSKVILKLFSF